MDWDPYELCPCGSGKKLKFCCHAVADELAHIGDLLMDRQEKLAEKALEKVRTKAPQNPWLMRLQIQAALMQGKQDLANEYAAEFTRLYPDNPFSVYFDVLVNIARSSTAASLEVIDQSVPGLLAQHPSLGAAMAERLVAYFMDLDAPMAARRWNWILPGLLPPEDRDRAIVNCRELDQDPSIPLPFRSSYQLRPLPEGQSQQAEFQAAMQLANTAQFLSAARAFEKLLETDPHQPVFSRNAGLCYAWAGDNAGAAEMLGLAADDTPDFEAGVELEVLAQLLDYQIPEEAFEIRQLIYPVKSVSRLLTLLDQQPRLARIEGDLSNPGLRKPTAIYHLLDQPAPPAEAPLTAETVPTILASLGIFSDEQHPSGQPHMVVGIESEIFQQNDLNAILGAVEEELQRPVQDGPIANPVLESIPREYAWMHWRWHVSNSRSRQSASSGDLIHAHWRQLIDQVWMNRPLSALDGASPAQAAGNPDFQVPLAAAVSVLEALCGTHRFILDVDGLRERLQLPPVAPLPFQPELPNEPRSLSETARLPFAELPDQMLVQVINQLMLVMWASPLEKAVQAALLRKESGEVFDPARLHEVLAMLAGQRRDRAAMLEHVSQWRNSLQETGKSTLETRISVDLYELFVRLQTPEELETKSFLQQVVRNYYSKVPELRQQVLGMFEELAVTNPELRSIAQGMGIVTVGGEDTTPGGLWTPDAAAAGAGSGAAGGGLWLPGQS